MQHFEFLSSLGSAPFGDSIGAFVFGAVGAITVLGILLDLQDRATGRAPTIESSRSPPITAAAPRSPRGDREKPGRVLLIRP